LCPRLLERRFRNPVSTLGKANSRALSDEETGFLAILYRCTRVEGAVLVSEQSRKVVNSSTLGASLSSQDDPNGVDDSGNIAQQCE
jgi:hypothetical protein